MSPLNCKRFFWVFVVAAIIFLTGCARTRYHSPSPSAPPAFEPEPAQNWAAERQSFIWPVKGTLEVPFGAKDEGVTTKGVWMRTPAREAPVAAARDGVVSLVDEKFGSFGKTVIVEHRDHWATVYAGNSQILVGVGQKVRQGEWIARASRLYFEIRKNSKAENPVAYVQ
ncbi:MAG: peptidoglycan DD-metalloendopeptidase family protein [Candidatus Omnitrophica bacterium]|nr:peptidoglycan DD-metalloendopeptidase family protein [Candidatus Omnitrophota bacterium]